MTPPGKELPPPAGAPDLTALLRSRHANTAAAPPATAPSTPPAPRQARVKAAPMDRRSWYMPREAADALAATLEELHFATRQPKHVIMAALVAVALEHADEIQQRVTE